MYREIFILQKEKKKLAIKAKRKKFYDDEEMEAEIKVRGRSMENEKINQSPCLLAFSTVQNASYPGFLDMKARDEEALSLLQAFDIIWELGLS